MAIVHILTRGRIVLNDAVVFTRHALLNIFIAVILAGIVGLVILSPFALAGIAHFRNDWLQLSNIGQTYGAISAILSALALGGILASLLYQSRDSRVAHEHLTRTFQFELIKLELEDPSLMAATGAPWNTDIPSESDALRKFLYVQMWVSYFAGAYATGETSASTVRQWAAHELYRGAAGRSYWAAVGSRQIVNSKGRYRDFFRLLDDEYRKAVSAGVPVAAPIEMSATSTYLTMTHKFRLKKYDRLAKLIIPVIIGVLLGRILGVKKRERKLIRVF